MSSARAHSSVMATLTTVVAACLAVACGPSRTSSTELPVAATTTEVADFARIVGGAKVRVYDLVRPGIDPHDFDPSPADLEALRRAAVVVENGVGLERWLGPALDAAGSHAVVVDTSAGITLRPGGPGEPGDPHIWHDPRNAQRMVTAVAESFALADPAHASSYRANGATYVEVLRALDDDIAGRLATLADKRLVTNHDAFGYYAARYGLDVIGSVIPSADTSAELSAAGTIRLVRQIKAQHVRAVFAESDLPPKMAAAIARQAGVKVVEGADALYGDSLGPTGSAGATYLQMMRHNTEVIVANLS